MQLRGFVAVSDRLISAIDAVLTVIFWLPARLIGYEKCSKCTIRVRWYQLLLILTRPLSGVRAVRSRRIDWRLRVDRVSFPRESLRRVSISDLEAL